MFPILAEAAAGVDLSSALPALSAVSSLGFAIWHSYYITTVVLPTMQKEHREEREKTQDAFTGTIKAMLDELKDARESYDRWRNK